MFKLSSGKYTLDWSDTVNSYGFSHVPADKYITLEFKDYWIRLDWGFTNV